MSNQSTVMDVNGHVFLAGGYWSSPVYKKAPGNLAKAAAVEGVTGKSLSAAFFQREQQIAFFSFSDKPKKGTPLAWAAISQVGKRSDFRLPFMGIFNLGPVWWFIVVDVVGNVLPGCDRTGGREEILGLLSDPDLAGMLNPFRENAFFLEDDKAAWQWLLEDLPRNAPVATPVNEKARRMAMGVTGAAVAIMVIGGGVAGWHWWQARTLRIQQAKQALLAQESRLSAAARLRAQAMDISRMRGRLATYWKNYPRPWRTQPSWTAFDTACEKAWKDVPGNVDGWTPSQIKCVAQGKSVDVTVTWSAGRMATVIEAPRGEITANGNVIVQTMGPSPISGVSADIGIAALSAPSTITRDWIGLRQEYAPEIDVSSGTLTAFTPPVPSFVPAGQVKNMRSPVLWRWFPVTLISDLPPWSGWPVPKLGFVPNTLIMNESGGRWSWILRGEQYAKP
jgi:hypothetical protein